MAQLTFYVPDGASDYDGDSSTNTTINAYDTVLFGSSIAYAEVDTSSLPAGAIVSAATFYYYHNSYTIGLGDTNYRQIDCYNGTGWNTLFTSTDKPPRAGWISVTLGAGCLDDVQVDGKFTVRFAVGNAVNQRNWTIRAYEYSPSPTYRSYLVVDYDLPAPQKTLVTNRLYLRGS